MTFDISSFTLHIIGMVLMLCDHLWATILPSYDILTWIGRAAFPFFAFLCAEGFIKTHDRKKYLKRMIVWACISEIPFNYMMAASPIYPFHQNVLFSFAISIACMIAMEKAKSSWQRYIVIPMLGCLGGLICMCDYFAFGIAMTLSFYIFHGTDWKNRIFQAVCMFMINAVWMKGMEVPIDIFNHTFYLSQQSMACLSLPVIWMYHGRQGPYNKAIRFLFYAFYPLHMIILMILLFAGVCI